MESYLYSEEAEARRKEDKWWASLSTNEKECVATSQNKDGYTLEYPACSAWWAGLDTEGKRKVRLSMKGNHSKN